MAGVDSTVRAALMASLGLDLPELAGELVLIAEVERWNIGTSATAEFYGSTDEYATDPSDTPANQPYDVCLNVPKFSQSILQSDWKHSTALGLSSISFDNIDGRIDGDFAKATYSWRGRKISLLAGLKTWTRSQFKPIPGGNARVLDVLPGEDRVRLTLTPLSDRPDRPVQPTLYGGYGGAYDFAGTTDVDCGDVYNLGKRDCTIEIRFKVDTVGGTNHVLVDKRGTLSSSAGSAGWILFATSADQLRFRLDDGTNTAIFDIGSAGEFFDGEWHHLTIWLDRTNNDIWAHVDRVEELATTDLGTMTGAIMSTQVLTQGSLNSGASNDWTGELDEGRIWYRLLTTGQGKNWSKSAVDGTEPGLVGAWNYDEYGGTDIFNLVLGAGLVQVAFNGSTTCSMGTSAMDPGTSDFTMTGWMRAAPGASGIVAGRRTSSATASVGVNVRLSSGDLIFDISDGTTPYTITITGDYDDGTLWGWALVRNGDELRAYVLPYLRGSLTAGTPQDITGIGTLGGGAVNFKLGAYDGGTSFFTGHQSWVFWTPVALDLVDVGIALSEQAIDLDDSAPTTPPALTAAAELSGAHFYPLDENTGSTATDQIGSADGTFSSAPTWIDRDGDLSPGLSGAWTSTLEGNIDLKGTPKPVSLGRPQRLLPVLVDQFFLIYQYSDPALGGTRSVEKAFAGALAMTLTTDYTVDLVGNAITLTASQDQPITLNVKGIEDDSGTWLQFPGELQSFVWNKMMEISLSEIDSTSTATYDRKNPYQQSLYLTTAPTSLDKVHGMLLTPDGYAFRTLDNKMALGTRKDPTSSTADLTLEDSDIERISPRSVPPPSWLVRIGHNRTWFTHSSFLGGADVKDQRQHQQKFRYVQDRRDEVRDDHADAIPRTFETGFHKRRDSQLLVQRMLDLDGVPRQGWTVDLGAEHWGAEIGDVVEIGSYSRYDVAGEKFLVVGYAYGSNQGAATSQLILWG